MHAEFEPHTTPQFLFHPMNVPYNAGRRSSEYGQIGELTEIPCVRPLRAIAFARLWFEREDITGSFDIS
jgi:hypothetical protein